jgi:hypothetical protein
VSSAESGLHLPTACGCPSGWARCAAGSTAGCAKSVEFPVDHAGSRRRGEGLPREAGAGGAGGKRAGPAGRGAGGGAGARGVALPCASRTARWAHTQRATAAAGAGAAGTAPPLTLPGRPPAASGPPRGGGDRAAHGAPCIRCQRTDFLHKAATGLLVFVHGDKRGATPMASVAAPARPPGGRLAPTSWPPWP